MQHFFSGLMGFFVGLGAFFHGGQGLPPKSTQVQSIQQAQLSSTPAPSGMMQRRYGAGRRMNLPSGERPFFGTVTMINGSSLTIQIAFPQRRMWINPSITPTITPGAVQSLIINLDSNTKYIGGAQSDIKVNTRIAGVGKANSEGSITATQIRINPNMPSPGRFRRDMDRDRY